MSDSPKQLTYTMLSDDEKLEYARIVNRRDPEWAEKVEAAEEKSRDVVRAMLTGGANALYHGGRGLFIFGRYLWHERTLRRFLENAAERHGCNGYDTGSFPNYYH